MAGRSLATTVVRGTRRARGRGDQRACQSSCASCDKGWCVSASFTPAVETTWSSRSCAPHDRPVTGAGRSVREGVPRPARRRRSGVLSVRALQTEEVALVPVLPLLLVEEVQLAGVEGGEPLVPAHVPEVVRVTAEVEPQHA